MRRILLAGMLALATATAASAQGPGCNTPGGCAPAMATANFGYGYGPGGHHHHKHIGTGFPPAGFYAFAYAIFPRIHQEGPLVNYGPYSGYYPFEPYGPWTSDLRYTGPLGGTGGGGGATGRLRIGDLSGGGFGGLHGVRHSPCGTCSSGHNWSSYSLATLKNIGHRINPWHHRGSGACSTCHSAIQPDQSIQAASLTVSER